MRSATFLLLSFVSYYSFGQSNELRKSIYFRGGSYYVDEFQEQELTRWLDSIPNLLDKYQVQLISHTDPIGGREFNEWLSKMRSGSVYQILRKMDIPEKFIHIKDWGLENPVYSNDSHQGLRLNRRVDVVLFPVVF